MRFLSELLAARCEFDAARHTLRKAEEITSHLGKAMTVTYYRWTEGGIEMLAEQWSAAETALRQIHQELADTAESWAVAGVGALLGEALLEQDRVAEAHQVILVAEARAANTTNYYQAFWRRSLARVEARNGHHERAAKLATEALALIESSDWLFFKSETELAWADVLRRAGREQQAFAAASRALELCEAKRHLAGIRRAQRFLGEPAAPTSRLDTNGPIAGDAKRSRRSPDTDRRGHDPVR